MSCPRTSNIASGLTVVCAGVGVYCFWPICGLKNRINRPRSQACGTNGVSRVLNHQAGFKHAGRSLVAAALILGATSGVSIFSTFPTFAQTQMSDDGLPIYDDRMGRPKSRLIDIEAPKSTAPPVVEAPVKPKPAAAQRPVEPTIPVEPMIEAEAPVAEAPAVEPVVETAATESMEEPVAEAAAVADTAPDVGAEAEETVTAAVEAEAEVEAAQPSAAMASGPIAVLFPAGGADLPGDGEAQLDSVVAALGADSGVRLQLKAYADGSDGAASAARRLSLSRALAVRGYLIDAGVSSTRIDVRALGSKFETGPADRVDVIPIK